ncbi:hypothetical protein MNB_SV-14-1043 [hydrothermal vent metagenome]|uniref:Uncharacterized protein n=1 Tax=hydrothermal vent metagenome TaxID=652676 RepID=A0A1W1CD52_9ZZZZ
MKEFEELTKKIEVLSELKLLKNKTKRAFSSVVRNRGEMTEEFENISNELFRVSEEFNTSIELVEKMIRLDCKKVV